SRQTIRCACLGTVFNLPMSTVTIIEDGVMLGMALLALIMPHGG
ncbi:MAG: heavy-metal-associated domain-containing protein, partial [Verrucomicrobia bacterium]|nr:heavy-metal-associated domain-containing protein [Verrucomicrobiota bacterium]